MGRIDISHALNEGCKRWEIYGKFLEAMIGNFPQKFMGMIEIPHSTSTKKHLFLAFYILS